MAVPKPLRLEIYLPPCAAQAKADDTFTHFIDCPRNIRRNIWRLALSQQRIIHIELEQNFYSKPVDAQEGKARHNQNDQIEYNIIVLSHLKYSPVFYANRESRELALSHYRVHLPCWRKYAPLIGAKQYLPRTIYFNPEQDFLFLDGDVGQFIEFLHDLRVTYDPRGVGLLNLVVDGSDAPAKKGFFGIDPEKSRVAYGLSYLFTLAQLREVFLLQQVWWYQPNILMPFHQYISDDLLPLPNDCAPLPLNSSATDFNRLGLDPRPIRQHLGKIRLDPSPDVVISRWKEYIHRMCGEQFGKDTRIYITLTSEPIHAIYDRQSAEAWWKEVQSPRSIGPQEDGSSKEAIVHRPMELSVEIAIRFWLFPQEEFEDFPSKDRSSPTFRPMNVWPQLALFDLA